MMHEETNDMASARDSGNESHNTSSNATGPSWSFLRVPQPLKQLFDQFPLHTYPAHELPQRTLHRREVHVLHVFTTSDDAARGRPSYNPQCLQYQAYLRFVGIRFRTIPSSNHASPSGSLPFLQPAVTESRGANPTKPVPSSRLRKWVTSEVGEKKPGERDDVRLETYQSLLDGRIRRAWLCQLYLSPPNAALVRQLYVDPCSTQPLVRLAIAHQLHAAAEIEVIKASRTNGVSILDVLRDAQEAFQSISELLGDDNWFSGSETPGMFDASVFAYTYLILSERLTWAYWPLRDTVSSYRNLVRHQQRILDLYF